MLFGIESYRGGNITVFGVSIAVFSRRAFLYFEDLEISENIDLIIIEGLYAGNDW